MQNWSSYGEKMKLNLSLAKREIWSWAARTTYLSWLQNKLTEKDGQILVARQELELAKKESQKATDTVKSALDQSTAAAAEKARLQTLNSELEAKAKKLEAELAAAKAAQPQVHGSTVSQ